MLVTIGSSRHTYQDALSCPMGLAIYEIFMNHTCFFSYHDPCTQICARFYAKLINEGQYYQNNTFLNRLHSNKY